MTVVEVFSVQMLQRWTMLFFPMRRDRQMARQTQDTCSIDKTRAIPRARQLFYSLKKKEGRTILSLKNDFPRIISLKRSYLVAIEGRFLLFPYFKFQS